jgi:hypothetical protein
MTPPSSAVLLISRRLIGSRRSVARCLFFAALGLSAVCAEPKPTLQAGATFTELTAGKTVYRNAKVRSVNARTLIIDHDAGLSSVPLRSLSPGLQAQFGYSPASEAAADAQLSAAQKRVEPPRQPAPTRSSDARASSSEPSKFETLLRNFGENAAPLPEVDLRPRFIELDLGVKNQGRRPSCSVFAIVSALEFQNAELIGRPEKLSEEYLLWATSKTLNRQPSEASDVTDAAPSEPGEENDKDAGFALSEVVTALRAYGIPPQSSLPNRFGVAMSDVQQPPDTVVAEARTRRQVHIHSVVGRSPSARLTNIVHALNAGVPVAIGVRWPHARTLRSGFLTEQKPVNNYAHAVTLVGYRCESGRLEDTVFIFKNSYGPTWGTGGYGLAAYRYLAAHLLDAVILEVLPASGA